MKGGRAPWRRMETDEGNEREGEGGGRIGGSFLGGRKYTEQRDRNGGRDLDVSWSASSHPFLTTRHFPLPTERGEAECGAAPSPGPPADRIRGLQQAILQGIKGDHRHEGARGRDHPFSTSFGPLAAGFFFPRLPPCVLRQLGFMSPLPRCPLTLALIPQVMPPPPPPGACTSEGTGHPGQRL